MHKDLFNNAKNVIAIPGTVIAGNGDTVSSIIDTDGFESGTITLLTTAYTSGNIVIASIAESEDSGMAGETDIPAIRLIGTPAAITAADVLVELGFVSTDRFIRVTITGADTSVMAVVALVTLADPSSAPVDRS